MNDDINDTLGLLSYFTWSCLFAWFELPRSIFSWAITFWDSSCLLFQSESSASNFFLMTEMDCSL